MVTVKQAGRSEDETVRLVSIGLFLIHVRRVRIMSKREH